MLEHNVLKVLTRKYYKMSFYDEIKHNKEMLSSVSSFASILSRNFTSCNVETICQHFLIVKLLMQKLSKTVQSLTLILHKL